MRKEREKKGLHFTRIVNQTIEAIAKSTERLH